MKLYAFPPAMILLVIAGFFTAAADRATDHGTQPLTKAALVRELSPIVSANDVTYNR